MLESYQEKLIGVLIDSKALAFGEFTLKSGRISPYFINMGRAVSNGRFLSTVSRCYCEKIMQGIGDDFDFIFGPAYKGIPLASSLAQTLWEETGNPIRWGYDRKEIKDYGDARDKVLVGELRDNDRVLIIDDVITTGGTKVEGWKKISGLRNAIMPKGIVVAVDREELDSDGRTPAETLSDEGLDLFSILTITEIFQYLLKNGKVDGELYDKFIDYRSI